MTDEEALKIIEAWADVKYRPTRDAACLALSALRERIERRNPQPLTLEELMKMDFSDPPIWDSFLNVWCAVRTGLSLAGKDVYDFGGGSRPIEANRFYRTKPETEQSNPDNTTAAANPYWQRVCAIADKQRAKGIAEYGQGLEDNPADIARRITYLEEEMVDGLMYCEWIKARLDGERPESDDR